MSSITVCARFRPLSSAERRENGDSVCIRCIDSESFTFKDEKEEECTFGFDRVFYENSEQADVFEFIALPIVRDVVNGTNNGSIITYGQTGAGKTYSIEGPGVLECDETKKGLLPRVVDGLFECIRSADKTIKYMVKLSMVEIYMEKVRDLLDLAKDNILIKESKMHGILLSGVTEIPICDPAEALQCLSVRNASDLSGIVNRAVGETQMNMASSRSHCVYSFTVQWTGDKRMKTGKIVIVDLAGSEKVEKTGAEGKVLEEAKTINKSLSALGNVVNALTCGPSAKASHIPYRDSKLTRILQDALGGNSRTALLCCCSPSLYNASETLSTLRFGSRAKHVKTSAFANRSEDKHAKKHGAAISSKQESCERILNKLREKMDDDDVNLLEELFIIEGIIFDPNLVEDLESTCEEITARTISALQAAVEKLECTVEELRQENRVLKARLGVGVLQKETKEHSSFLQKTISILRFISDQSRFWKNN